jgi:hypothetical protein
LTLTAELIVGAWAQSSLAPIRFCGEGVGLPLKLLAPGPAAGGSRHRGKSGEPGCGDTICKCLDCWSEKNRSRVHEPNGALTNEAHPPPNFAVSAFQECLPALIRPHLHPLQAPLDLTLVQFLLAVLSSHTFTLTRFKSSRLSPTSGVHAASDTPYCGLASPSDAPGPQATSSIEPAPNHSLICSPRASLSTPPVLH